MKKITVYTDGACSGNPGPGGYGAILIFNGKEKEISGYAANTTNNRMELTAVIEALKCLNEQCEIDLYTDSTYVANAFLKGWVFSWKKKNWHTPEGGMRLNYDLWQVLYDLASNHEITWNVVKGHADNEYNNRCDKLAVAEYKNKSKKNLNSDNNSSQESFEESFDMKNAVIEDVDEVLGVKNKPEFTDSIKDDGNPLNEKIIFNQTAFQGRIFKIDVMEVKTPDGKLRRREVLRHNGGCGILPVDSDGYVTLVEQYRCGAGKVLLEIPAGKMEPDEDPLVCATRELTEETGLVAGNIKHMVSLYATPGYCSEKIHIYLATDLKMAETHRDEDEFMNIKKIHIDQLKKMVANKEIEDGKTATAVLMYDLYK